MATLQDVFKRHFAQYAQGRSLHPRETNAAGAILKCFTEDAGSHTDACPDGHYHHQTMHACRHRSCPRCARRPQLQWAQAQMQRLLPVAHHHVIFTLPHELLPLWAYNRAAFSQLLFDAVRQTLLELMADPRHLGALPGLLMTLHTWGRTLSQHPHIHALVTAGGVDAQGRWRATNKDYLLPLKVVQRLFAGKVLGLMHERMAQWALPPRQPQAHWRAVRSKLYRAHWNVQINPPYEHGRGVAVYLARYAKGGPLPADRALGDENGRVSFSYTDHRDARTKRLQLQPAEFIARVLWHAPPKGCHTVRHAGLYATARRRHHARALLSLSIGASPLPTPDAATRSIDLAPAQARHCPVCRQALRRSYTRPWLRGRNQISLSSQRPDHKAPCTKPGARPNATLKRKFDGLRPGAAAKALTPGLSPSNSA
jgi:hypothetical protein